jgi:hypothetical protein
MTTNYPAALDSYTNKVDGHDTGTLIACKDVNDLQDAIAAIEAVIGLLPQGAVTDLVTRLAQSLDGYGRLDFANSSTIGISGGVILPVKNWYTVDTEGSAAADDLDTITATSLTDGFVLVLRQYNSARVVTIKHNTGNISCPGGMDIVFTDTTQVVVLIWDTTLSRWLASLCPANVPLTNKANTFAAEQIFTKARRRAYTSVAVNTTLDATHDVVDVDASGAARTITLPTAAGINGRTYLIRKLDSSANTVTIDGYSAETINGAATKVLSTQYATAEIISDGANWIVA